ncbi:MAG: hypothetical protein JW723_02440 [Bacteroidales bacterium]|nr:hypothetical protein [Bacteroidales bacterium]
MHHSPGSAFSNIDSPRSKLRGTGVKRSKATGNALAGIDSPRSKLRGTGAKRSKATGNRSEADPTESDTLAGIQFSGGETDFWYILSILF